MPTLEVQKWGIIDYEQAASDQLSLVEKRARDEINDTVIFCTHPPVVTLGRGTTEDDVFDWDGKLVEATRGGRATYHGPSQLIVYPIIKLTNRDIHAYLRALEQATVAALKHYNVEAEARTTEMRDKDGKKLQQTGVWVGEKKIASIGIAVKKWVTYHGIAINIKEDSEAFKGINPCGFKKETMTHLNKEAPDLEKIWLEKFKETMSL